ncbi:MAG: hypothetical protein QOI64_531 [Solirubrobacteraceae bacterium]|nr:hypothetical protein [Solirubrobacteraceae bacterium]
MAELVDIDRALADLHTGADRLGRLLLELELDGDRKLLDDAPLKGATASRWSAVAGDLLAAWESHAELTATLERADELRGSRPRLRAERRTELEALLGGRPERLRSALQAAEEAAAIVAEAAAAWGALTPRISAAGDAIRAGGLDGLDGAYERVCADLAADPLSVPAQVDALERAVEDARRELADFAAMREEAAERIAAARSLMDSVEAAQRDGEAAHELVLAKIANPSVPAPRRVLSDLLAGLREIESLVERARWAQARDALARWTGDATPELERALAIAAANRAPIERRNQLRGLLKAYQGKARSLRALEDEQIAALFEGARHELYTAPTDLGVATELITRYQEALR